MQTQLLDTMKATEQGQEAEEILRTCVHCGMCNATCPTYQLLGDELDGPRGRIYLIKQVLEGKTPTSKTQTHLDRCLTCLSCETTCPSGVQYGRLLEIGRELVEQNVGRSWSQKILRTTLKNGLSNPRIFQQALKISRIVSGLLPSNLREKMPAPTNESTKDNGWPQTTHVRKVLLLDGCVQPSLAPHINAATARVLDRLHIQAMLAPQAACCGAVRLHLNDASGAISAAKRNIDAWWSLLSPDSQSGVEAIVMTASGCGVMVKDYGQLLKHDPEYADKAQLISKLTCDLSEFLPNFESELIAKIGGDIQQRVSWHPPCTLQHGQKIRGKVENLLRHLGVDVQLCVDSHLCCGSAGTYSILQSDLAQKLRQHKVAALEATRPELIVSANMACQQHLQAATAIPVKHWIELLDQALASLPPSESTGKSLSQAEQTGSVTNLNKLEVVPEMLQSRSIEALFEPMAVTPIEPTKSIEQAPKKKSTRKSDKALSNKKGVAKSKTDVLEAGNTLENSDDKKVQKPRNRSSKKKR
jgi:glycolate oxidase iron-sulfur subunit